MVALETQQERALLAGVGVLITRPAHQAEHLAQLIEAAGGVAVRFPTIDIVPPDDPGPLLAVLDRLADYDLAIFISPNAVEQTFSWLRAAKREWPKRLPIACVGRATAATVENRGLNATTPTERFDSEALLGLPLLQNVDQKKVVIFRGDGGRELLGSTLALRGAVVSYAESYRRVRPRTDVETLIDAWRRGEIQIVTITSTEGLRNLHEMLGETGRSWLYDTPLVVLSQAQAAACRELGCTQNVSIATEASDEAILEAVKTWRREYFSR
ncbi:MAG TPA: uroporphyrinogen-III synthase [Burkholderiales bacterium]